MLYFITIYGFVQSAIALYLLQFRSSSSRHYDFLKILIALILVHLGVKLFLLGFLENQQLFSQLHSFTSFSYGPLVWFQYRHFLHKSLDKVTYLLHLIPFVLAAFVYFLALVFQLPEQFPDLFNNLFINFGRGVVISFIIYSSFILWDLRSQALTAELRLIRQITVLLLSTALVGFLLSTLQAQKIINFDSRHIAYLFLGAIPFVCLSFFYLQPVQSLSISTESQINPLREKEVSYAKSGMSLGDIEAGWIELEYLMQHQKPYLNPDLALETLAQKLQLSRQHLSQILTTKAQKNFYTYVNEYRVSEVLRLMKLKPQERILALALEAGFQSKSTFNTYFKKVTNLNPSDYQLQINGETTKLLK
jgi:AraC-like DNA-binding protein